MAGESLNVTLSSTKPADVVMSPDGTKLYAAGSDGRLRFYNIASNSLEATWRVGRELGGMDVSPDGSFLMIVERQPLATSTAAEWRNDTLTVTTYKVRLSPARITSFDTVMTGYHGVFFDVAIGSDGNAVLGQSFRNVVGSGPLLWHLNTSSGNYTNLTSLYATENVMLWRDASGGRILIGPDNAGDAPIAIFRPGLGFTKVHDGGADGVKSWGARSVSAISSEANLVAQSAGRLYIYDANLKFSFNLSTYFPELRGPGIVGLDFDAQGNNLYILDQRTDSIIQVSTNNWKIVARFSVGVDVDDLTEMFPEGDYGNQLQVSPDGQYFTVVTGRGIQLVGNPALANRFTGTDANDVFSSGAGGDQISGRGGNDSIDGGSGGDTLRGEAGHDWLVGGTGADILDGGVGNDGFSVDHVNDVVIELAGQGTDSVRSNVSYVLPSHVEILTLVGRAEVNATGNPLANVLTGNDARNRLDGAAAADTMSGGKGHDTYVVDNAGDLVVELGSSGTDSVESSVDFWLPNHVEKLMLTGTGNIDGRGNGLANAITGNGRTNILEGGRGDDTINGGAGNDRLYGSDGHDVLIGGTGSDAFFFNSGPDAAHADRILDFDPAADTIRFARNAFAGLHYTGAMRDATFRNGAAAADSSDRIVYHQAKGNIFYDSDGSGAAQQVLIATVTPGTPLTAADFIIYG